MSLCHICPLSQLSSSIYFCSHLHLQGSISIPAISDRMQHAEKPLTTSGSVLLVSSTTLSELIKPSTASLSFQLLHFYFLLPEALVTIYGRCEFVCFSEISPTCGNFFKLIYQSQRSKPHCDVEQQSTPTDRGLQVNYGWPEMITDGK